MRDPHTDARRTAVGRHAALRIALLGALLLAPLSASDAQGSGGKPRAGRSQSGDARPRAGKEAASSINTRADRYFDICDYDADGWISFKEAQASLSLDRDGFAIYDGDRDGRIIRAEFRRRYAAIVDSGGLFPPPKAKAVVRAALPATAEKALEMFDKDRDGALDEGELDVALAELGAARMEPQSTLEQFDRDGSNKLEPAEIDDLLLLLKPGSSAARGPRPRSIDELFGKLVSRGLPPTATPQPARIVGPVPTFRRLDIDGDGGITLEDLGELQRPLVLSVRAPAVLAALDTDGDGSISPAEFRASMRSVRSER